MSSAAAKPAVAVAITRHAAVRFIVMRLPRRGGFRARKGGAWRAAEAGRIASARLAGHCGTAVPLTSRAVAREADPRTSPLRRPTRAGGFVRLQQGIFAGMG
ncbi:MAG: hypothetical protein BGO49_18160 [Planctomycetales bacterium 71-10]|nr:MAG: hypothetical protein BGO49_18160 [Planctomycetales bacterium 71-10]